MQQKSSWKKVRIAFVFFALSVMLAGLALWWFSSNPVEQAIQQAAYGEIWKVVPDAGGVVDPNKKIQIASFSMPSEASQWSFSSKPMCKCFHFLEVRLYDRQGQLLLRAEYCNHCFDVEGKGGMTQSLRIDSRFYQFLSQQEERGQVKSNIKKEKRKSSKPK